MLAARGRLFAGADWWRGVDPRHAADPLCRRRARSACGDRHQRAGGPPNAFANLCRTRSPAMCAGGRFRVRGGRRGRCVSGLVIGKAVNGQHLLVLFALLMLVVAGLMLRGRAVAATAAFRCRTRARVAVIGLGAGHAVRFLRHRRRLPDRAGPDVRQRHGDHQRDRHLAVFGRRFALTTAANYAISGLIDWRVAAEFIGGGILGGWLGATLGPGGWRGLAAC